MTSTGRPAGGAADGGRVCGIAERGRPRAVRSSSSHKHWGVRIIGFIALVFGTLNVIGGFLVTDRMLSMFKGKKVPKKDDALPVADKAKEVTK